MHYERNIPTTETNTESNYTYLYNLIFSVLLSYAFGMHRFVRVYPRKVMTPCSPLYS